MSDSERLAELMATAIKSIGHVPNYGITHEQKEALKAAQFAADLYLDRGPVSEAQWMPDMLDEPPFDEEER